MGSNDDIPNITKYMDNHTAIPNGSTISLSFNAGTVEYGWPSTRLNVTGTIPLLLPSGTYKFPNIVKDSGILEETAKELAIQYGGLWPNGSESTIKAKARDTLVFASFLNPTDDASCPKMQALTLHTFLTYAIGDLMYSSLAFPEKSLKYSDIKSYIGFLEKLFTGCYKSKEDILNPIMAIEPANDYILKYLEMAEEAIPEFYSRNKDLKYSWMNTLRAWILTMGNNPIPFSSITKPLLATQMSGGLPQLEFMILVRDICLSAKVRQDMVFQRLTEAYAHASRLMNDIIGFKIDVEHGLIHRSSILRKVQEEGVNLKAAFDLTYNELCTEIEDIKMINRKLTECYSNDINLLNCLSCIEHALDGQAYAYGMLSRYGRIGMEIVQV